jgi:hypothetical protein
LSLLLEGNSAVMASAKHAASKGNIQSCLARHQDCVGSVSYHYNNPTKPVGLVKTNIIIII